MSCRIEYGGQRNCRRESPRPGDPQRNTRRCGQETELSTRGEGKSWTRSWSLHDKSEVGWLAPVAALFRVCECGEDAGSNQPPCGVPCASPRYNHCILIRSDISHLTHILYALDTHLGYLDTHIALSACSEVTEPARLCPLPSRVGRRQNDARFEHGWNIHQCEMEHWNYM